MHVQLPELQKNTIIRVAMEKEKVIMKVIGSTIAGMMISSA